MASPAQYVAPRLAALLDHPDEGLARRAADCATSLAEVSPSAAGQLIQFSEAMAALPVEGQQELHDRTFDLNPSCTPFLSVHLFGEESFKRAEFMAGLAEAYARAAFTTGGEVPDHLGVILRFAPTFPAEEWAEMGRYCFPVALGAMRACLARSSNPYGRLVDAVIHLLGTDFPDLLKEKPCSTSSFSAHSLTLPSSHLSPGPCGGCGPTPSATPPCHPSS